MIFGGQTNLAKELISILNWCGRGIMGGEREVRAGRQSEIVRARREVI